ncbi:MAG: hypothetical protein U5S82_01930 [Gammaproteobacteria bacterium]|nr:hypothetical protein [Gammaproteobacteria bacterium]
MKTILSWLGRRTTDWLTGENARPAVPLCDFKRLRFELRPADVLLVEGRSRVGDVIKLITQSPWSHAALYIGRLFDIRDEALRERVRQCYRGDPREQTPLSAAPGDG